MKKIASILLLSQIIFICNAQQNLPVPVTITYNDALLLNADIELNSSSITNEFINAYLNGDYITEDLKNSVISRLKNNNILGYQANQKLTYVHSNDSLLKRSRTGYLICIENHDLMEIGFRKDFFKLFFNGNRQYQGQNVDLSDMRFNSVKYQQFKIGLFKTIRKAKGIKTISAAIAFNLGQNNLSASINNASLFTHHNGEYIDFYINSDIKQSDTSNKNILTYNGFGSSLDFFYKFSDHKGNTIIFEINNLGFISWDKHSYNFTKDTLFHFEGWHVENIFDMNSMIFQERINDSLYYPVFNSNNKSGYISMLPMSISLSYSKVMVKNRLHLTGKAQHIFFTLYRPFFLFSCDYQFHEFFQVSPLVSYGGYGLLNAGIEIKMTGHRFCLTAGSNFINSMIKPNSTSGQGVYVSLYKIF